MEIYDKEGNRRDEAWLREIYGLVKFEGSFSKYRIKELRDIEGPTAFLVTVLKEDGTPKPGVPVLFTWGADGKDPLQHTNEDGIASHTAGGGAYYHLPGPGPHQEEVDGLRITGLGWPWGSNHRHLNVVLIETEDDPPPGPPADFDIFDKHGHPKGTEWLKHFFGTVEHHVAEEDTAFRLMELREIDGGDCKITVQDDSGNPLPGALVSFRRADGSMGNSSETDPSGVALFPLGDDATYPVPGQGPYLAIIRHQASDAVVGLGRVMGTPRHLDILFRADGPSPEPEPPTDMWAILFSKLDTIIKILESRA